MSRAWKQWLVRIGGILVVACAEPIAPTSSPPPVQLVFTMQPSSATAGVAIDPVVAVAIEDAFGALVPSATNVVTVAIGTNAGGGTLTGTVSVAAVAGVATFSNLHVDKAGGYTLQAAAGTLTGATSMPFTIVAAPATTARVHVQPSNVMGGVTITPPVQIAAQDSFGNRATGFADSVTVALADARTGRPLRDHGREGQRRASRSSAISRSRRRAPDTPSRPAPEASRLAAACCLRSPNPRGRCTSRPRPAAARSIPTATPPASTPPPTVTAGPCACTTGRSRSA